MKKGDFIALIWHDAFTPKTNVWMEESAVNRLSHEVVSVLTVGIFWSLEKNGQLTIVQGYAKEDDGAINPFSIPVGCIRYLKKIKVK